MSSDTIRSFLTCALCGYFKLEKSGSWSLRSGDPQLRQRLIATGTIVTCTLTVTWRERTPSRSEHSLISYVQNSLVPICDSPFSGTRSVTSCLKVRTTCKQAVYISFYTLRTPQGKPSLQHTLRRTTQCCARSCKFRRHGGQSTKTINRRGSAFNAEHTQVRTEY